MIALALLLAAGPVTNPQAITFTQDSSQASRISLAAKLSQTISVKDAPFLAKGDGVADDTAAIQAALNTGANVLCPKGTYKITNSLFMISNGQELRGECVITMDASLGKPALWLGASDAAGTDNGTGVADAKVRGIRFAGTGAQVAGSAGVAFMHATTSTVDVRSWSFYAGIDVRGYSIANTLIAPNLQLNTVGLRDTTATGQVCPTCSTFEGSTIIGGRIENNATYGVDIGSAGVSFIRTVIEGNSPTGALAQVRIRQGFDTGPISFVNAYLEEQGTNTATSMIRVDDPACVTVELIDTQVNGLPANAANLYIIDTGSTCTAQGFNILGGRYINFKNYIHGAIANNSVATVFPSWADISVDVTADLTATAGARIWQTDRVLGFKTTAPVNSLSLTTTAASGATAIQMTLGSILNLGNTSTITGNGTGQLILSGNTFVGPAGSSTLHAGTMINDSANSATLKGSMADNASAIGGIITNSVTLTNAAAKSGCFSPDSGVTKNACVDLKGGLVQSGITFANLATGSTANGTLTYCSDCTIANPCAGGGTGAFAKRLNGVWVCN